MDARDGGMRLFPAARRQRWRILARGGLLLLFAASASCGDVEPERDAPPMGEAPETTMIPVRPPPRLVARDSLPTRIFYDLTRFDWYAHGEPLVWDGREWQPSGSPTALPTESLRHVGEFEGVDVWIRADEDSVTRLFVPVSEGFWLPFAAESGSAP